MKSPEARSRTGESTEVRAIWVTRWDYRSASDVRKIIAGCSSLGLNRIIFQVRGQADAYYRSSFEPWGEGLGGSPERDGDPGFDPLAVALEEAKKQGISLHAWINVLPGWKGAAPPRSRKHLVHTHPEWFLAGRGGRRTILSKTNYALLNPCLPEVRVHLVLVVAEIATRYPVDGILFDYIRFLHRGPGEDGPLDAATLKLFWTETGTTPRENPPAWDRFRRRAVDRVVEEMSRVVRRQRPPCRISVAAVRERDRARSRLFQDALAWKRRGWIDDIYPMNYVTDPVKFDGTARNWVRACGGSSVIIGVGVHLLRTAPRVHSQIQILRSAPSRQRAAGYCLFAYSELFDRPWSTPAPGTSSAERKSSLRALLLAVNGMARL